MLFATKNSEKTSRGPVAEPRSNRRPSRGTTYLRRAIFAISGPLHYVDRCENVFTSQTREDKIGTQRSESFIKIKWNFQCFFSDSLTKNIFRVRTQWSFVSTVEKSIFFVKDQRGNFQDSEKLVNARISLPTHHCVHCRFMKCEKRC